MFENQKIRNFQEQIFEISLFLPQTADSAGTPSFNRLPKRQVCVDIFCVFTYFGDFVVISKISK